MSEDYRIVDLSPQECWEILDRERFGRLALAVHGDPDICLLYTSPSPRD